MHHEMGGACGCGMGHGKHIGVCLKAMFKIMPWKIIMHSEELGLSDDQVEAFRKKHSEARKQMIHIFGQIKANMIDVEDAVMREDIDMPTAEAKIREIGKLKGDKMMAMIQAMQDMREILTPEQRRKIKEMVMSWFKKGGMRGIGMEEGGEGEGEESEE